MKPRRRMISSLCRGLTVSWPDCVAGTSVGQQRSRHEKDRRRGRCAQGWRPRGPHPGSFLACPSPQQRGEGPGALRAGYFISAQSSLLFPLFSREAGERGRGRGIARRPRPHPPPDPIPPPESAEWTLGPWLPRIHPPPILAGNGSPPIPPHPRSERSRIPQSREPADRWSAGSRLSLYPASAHRGDQAVNELPHPQPPVALGLLKVKPLPWKVDT
jgi:hypothetical protein